MDDTSLVSALMSAQTGQLQLAVAAKVLRMNADQDAAVAKLLESARQNADRLANVAADVGANLDISV